MDHDDYYVGGPLSHPPTPPLKAVELCTRNLSQFVTSRGSVFIAFWLPPTQSFYPTNRGSATLSVWWLLVIRLRDESGGPPHDDADAEDVAGRLRRRNYAENF